MSNKPPAFQFYAKDWLTSETVLSMDFRDQGIYMRILAASWMSSDPGTIPLPLSLGAKVIGLPPRLVLAFLTRNPGAFTEVDGRLVNEKLHAQWLELKDLREKRIKLGRRGGLAKARNLLEQNPSPASPTPTALSQIQSQRPSAKAADASHPPVEKSKNQNRSEALKRIADHLDYRKEEHDRALVENRGLRESRLPFVPAPVRINYIDPGVADAIRKIAKRKAI